MTPAALSGSTPRRPSSAAAITAAGVRARGEAALMPGPASGADAPAVCVAIALHFALTLPAPLRRRDPVTHPNEGL